MARTKIHSHAKDQTPFALHEARLNSFLQQSINIQLNEEFLLVARADVNTVAVQARQWAFFLSLYPVYILTTNYLLFKVLLRPRVPNGATVIPLTNNSRTMRTQVSSLQASQ
jgi:hypothetical protein